jgi:hypothetical protein
MYFPILNYIINIYACILFSECIIIVTIYLLYQVPVASCMDGHCKKLNHCSLILNRYCWITDPIGTISHVRSSIEKAAVVPCQKVRWNSNNGLLQHLTNGEKHIHSHTRGKKTLVSCAKTIEAVNTTKSDGGFYCL